MENETQKILAALAAPFAPEEVDWRCGTTKSDKSSAMALAYIDARTVADRLDAVCGAHWRCRYYELRNGARAALADRDEGSRAKRGSPSIIICEIEIKFGDEWIGRADGSGDTDMEAEKGALSGAFKRAAARWGIGRYLYGFPSPWVAITQHGRSYAIARDEWPKLRKLAADALAAYVRDPRAFLAPRPPEPEPERPGFTPAAAPPARPEPPPKPAAPPTSGPPHAFTGDEVRTIQGLRAHLDAGKPLDGVTYVAAVRTLLQRAQTEADIGDIVGVLKTHAPPKGHGLHADVEQARRRVAQGAQS